MNGNFGPEFFKNNRLKLTERFGGTAPIIITANGLLASGDNNYPFRQDSNFWYLTGLDEPDLVLVLDKGREYLFMPERSPERLVFDGSLDPAVLKATSGISEILPESAGWPRLSRRLKKVKHAASLAPMPAYIAERGLYSNPTRQRLIGRIKHLNPQVRLVDLNPHLRDMRMVKQPPEIQAITSNVKVTIKALMMLYRQNLSRYRYEYEVEALITAQFGRRGFKHAFEPIVAGGKNATQLHYAKNHAPLRPRSLLLVDIGAWADHYGADLTRTFAPGGKPTKRQQKVHHSVLAIQNFAFGLLKPGLKLESYEKQIREYTGEKLRELGLIRLINEEQVQRFYPHSTSHWLGLDTHDVGDYQRPLEPGMVLTVEPGIYIAKEGLGIRIEDNVLITSRGARVLSARLKRDLC